jgi:hypothetical protein
MKTLKPPSATDKERVPHSPRLREQAAARARARDEDGADSGPSAFPRRRL